MLASRVTEPSLQSESPLQLLNVEPEAAVAVKVITVLVVKLAEQVEPQLIPDGLLVTVPLPFPALVTDNVNWFWFADTITAFDRVSVLLALVEQPSFW